MYFKHVFTQFILSGSTEDHILQIMRLTVIKFSFYIVFKAFMREKKLCFINDINILLYCSTCLFCKEKHLPIVYPNYVYYW